MPKEKALKWPLQKFKQKRSKHSRLCQYTYKKNYYKFKFYNKKDLHFMFTNISCIWGAKNSAQTFLQEVNILNFSLEDFISFTKIIFSF
jgi:hypothetical protein